MALVDARDKTYDGKVMTSYHAYRFGRTEKPKVLDLFNIEDSFSKSGRSTIKYVYGGFIWKEVAGQRVHKGFYAALKDFIKRSDQVLVKLTKEEEDFFKKSDPDIYEKYVNEHKGLKFVHELREEREAAKQIVEPEVEDEIVKVKPKTSRKKK